MWGVLSQGRKSLGTVGSVAEFVANIVALITLVGGFVLAAVKILRNNAPGQVAALSVLAVGVSYAAGWLTSARGRRRHAVCPMAEAATMPGSHCLGYTCVATHFEWIIDPEDPRHTTQIMRKTVKAFAGQVQIVENRYRWTGEGREPLPSTQVPGQRVLSADPILREDAYRVFYVFLDTPLTRGETTTIVVRQEFYDDQGVLQPFLAMTVSELLGELTLSVRMPSDLLASPRAVHAVESGTAANGQRSTLNRCPVVADDRGVITHTWRKVVLGNRYEIRWVWKDYPPAADPDGSVDLRGREPTADRSSWFRWRPDGLG